MKILTTRPPVADKIKEVFGTEFDDGNIIVTYGDDVYTKSGYLPPDLFAHEIIHVMQQTKMTPIQWWVRYFEDPEFRLSQELEAYRNQYTYYLDNIKDRNILYRELVRISRGLAGPTYGNIISADEALKLIKQK